MSEELSLKETIKNLEEKISESLEGKSKKPKFKLPLGVRMNKVNSKEFCLVCISILIFKLSLIIMRLRMIPLWSMM